MFSKIYCLLIVVTTSACISSNYKPRLDLEKKQALEILVERAVKLIQESSDCDECLEQARIVLSLAIEIDSTEPKIHDALGAIAWREKNYSLAKASFEKAIQSDHSYSRGYAHLALVNEFLGNRDKAAKLYLQALKLDPLDSRTRNNYALFLGGQLQELQKALIVEPNDRIIKQNLDLLSRRVPQKDSP